MKVPKVSICIPTYNQTIFLKRNLESILIQNYNDYEVIITDDSTTNEVENLVNSYDFNGRLVYIKNIERLGSPNNWNEAMAHAKAEYIKILHHDDWFTTRESLGTFVNAMERNNECMFAFSYSTTHFKNIFKKIHSVDISIINLLISEPERLIISNYIGGPSSTIFRKSLNIEFDKNLKWLVDVDFYINCIKKSSNLFCIKEPLVATIAWEDHQITRQFEKNKNKELLEYFYVYSKHVKQLKTILKHYFIPVYQKVFAINNISTSTQIIKNKQDIMEADFLEKIFKMNKINRMQYKIKEYSKNLIKHWIISANIKKG